METVRALCIGDVVGDAGLEVLESYLPILIQEFSADLVLVNGENAAAGFGLTEATLVRILQAGADVVSTGNHIWEKRDFWPILDTEQRVLRPANYPLGLPGRGFTTLEKKGLHWFIINLQGRENMNPIDCPFRALDTILAEREKNLEYQNNNLILVDFHAESTQEKEALAFYADGRISTLVGTHTHVQTADERILPKGTAYISDLGMTGAIKSIIGMDTKICLERNRTQVPHKMVCPAGPGIIQGIVVELDPETGKGVNISRVERKA